MSVNRFRDTLDAWRGARAFVVDNYVCGDFSVPSEDDVADAEIAEQQGETPEFDPCVCFYIYGEHGLRREFFVDRKMIENAEDYGSGMKVVYYDGAALTIEPLVTAGEDTGHSAVGERT